jgi:hypothetical protein
MNIKAIPRARVLLLLGTLVMVGCAAPPRGTATDAGRRAEPEDAAKPSASEEPQPYEFEREGTFPAPTRDVTFEEDQLPPRPENVDAARLTGSEVRSTELDEPGQRAPDERREPTVATPAPPSVTTPAPVKPAPMRMGFRVQLIAAADRVEAEQFAREARSRLGVAIHVEFEAPYYKVRAGDFVDRADALVLRDRARATGYEGAWVTSTRIAGGSQSGS